MISRVGICSADVARMTVTLQFDGDHFKVLSEGEQQAGEAALDRAYYAMQQHKRSAAAMALVVHVERTHIEVAGKLRHRDRLVHVPARYPR